MSFGDAVPKSVQFVLGGLAGMTASAVTHPLDTLKVQLQLQGKKAAGAAAASTAAAASAPAPLGSVAMASKLVREGGVVKGLYPGLSASLARQGTYTTTRMGLYMILRGDNSKNLGPDGKPKPIPLWRTAGASLVAGAVGAFVGNPNDVVLIRMQGDLAIKDAAQKRGYRHVVDGLARITREEGFGRLYTGAGPNMQRAALITLGQLASYDKIKGTVLQYMDDGFAMQVVCATVAGGITAAITNPVDVIKTRIMADQSGAYKNTLTAARLILARDGPLAFYKGFGPYFARMGPQTIVTLVAYEQYAKVYRALSKQN